MHQVALELAGLRIRVRTNSPDGITNASHRFGAYLLADADEAYDLSLDVTIDAELSTPSLTDEPVEYPGVETATHEDGSVEFRRHDLRMELDSSRTRARVTVRPSLATHLPTKDPTPLDTPLRLLLASALPKRDGLLLHASGYADARGAILFAGESGAGKTTTALKLPHENVLSDDQIAVRRVDGTWVAWSLPMVGRYGRPTESHHARLRTILLLRKSDGAPAVTSIRGADALVGLARCVCRFEGHDSSAHGFLALVASLASEVDVATLALSKDAELLALVAELLGPW